MPLAAIVLADVMIPSVEEPLALLPWTNDQTLVEYCVAQIVEAGVRDVEVVLGPAADRIIPLVARDNIEPIVNSRWREGRDGSLRAGAAAVPRGTTVALLCDVAQPRASTLIRALIEAHEAHPADVTRPAHNGAQGWPIIFGEAALAALRNVTHPDGLDALMRRFAATTGLVACGADARLSIRSREHYTAARPHGS
jgi:CTP:molybdopterin cytidylyltransferase MocA